LSLTNPSSEIEGEYEKKHSIDSCKCELQHQLEGAMKTSNVYFLCDKPIVQFFEQSLSGVKPGEVNDLKSRKEIWGTREVIRIEQ
jgi:hypothetical protein